jgi:exopolysaccharide production protein ExoZ
MRFNSIQMLRFVAAAGVLLYHAGVYTGDPALARLFDARFSWGVELFFAISGFVIAHAISRMPPARFLIHRAVRIYPAYAVAFVAVIGVKFLLGRDEPSVSAVLRGFALLPVCCAEYPLGVEWSLVYEIFFYALVAAVAWLPWRCVIETAMVVWIAAIVVAAWAGPTGATQFLPGWRLILLSAFNLPFIAGVLAYAWLRRVEHVPIVPLLVLTAIALVAADRMAMTEAQLACLALGFGALVLAAAEASRRHDVSLRHPLVRLGDASYGLYLIHVPIVKSVAAAFGATALGVTSFVCAIALALAIGCSFGAVEMAFYRRNKARLDALHRTRPVTT